MRMDTQSYAEQKVTGGVGCDEVPPTRPCKGGQYRPRKQNAPSRKLPEREMGDPEGNLVIAERVEHECQRRFSDWEYGWVGTAHVLTSTLYGWTDSSWLEVPHFLTGRNHFTPVNKG